MTKPVSDSKWNENNIYK